MFFLKSPVPLWFLAGGGPLGSSLELSVSVGCKISCPVAVLESVDIDLSALAFGLSASFSPEDPEERYISVQAGIDLDDNQYSSLDLRASITPVFVIDQSGQISASATFDLTASASITASIGVDVVPSANYQVSASITVSIEMLGETLVCVSTNYQISASIGVLLQVQLGQLDKDIDTAYGLSASINPVVAIVNQGGLVWSFKKQKYIAVRVGSV